MANKKIQEIEGIGPVQGEKFEAAVVKDTDSLLAKGGTKAGRKALAEVNGEKKLTRKVPTESQVEEWVKQAGALPPAVTH